jgi:hypothetical protein
METQIALITYDELNIVVIVVCFADLAGHILEAFVPFLWCDIHWAETQVTFASFGSAQAFRQRRVEHIELIVESQLVVFFDVSERKNTDANFA